MELIRKLLVQLEAKPNQFERVLRMPAVDGYPPDVVAGHLQLLDDAGFIEAKDITTMGAGFRVLVPSRLTNAGPRLSRQRPQ